MERNLAIVRQSYLSIIVIRKNYLIAHICETAPLAKPAYPVPPSTIFIHSCAWG